MTPPLRPTRAVVDLAAIRHNVARLAELADPAPVCAVVKADGYGHGAVEVARAALDGGAGWLAVALVEEGEQLRAAGVDAPVLLFAEPPPHGAERVVAARLTAPLYTHAFADALDAAARAAGVRTPAQVVVDTGMGRVGIPPHDPDGLLAHVAGLDHLDVDGIWTHLARADEPVATTATQLERFAGARARAHEAGLRPTLAHAANSAGTLLHPDARLDLVRPGIAVYGLSPGPDVDAAVFGLRPALQLVTDARFVKHVTAGTQVSYGHRWAAPHDGWLVTLQIGYADGVPRSLLNAVDVLVDGVRRPLVGRVCMDQVHVWCGGDRPEVGAEVVLIGRRGQEAVRLEDWAAVDDTITYELATRVTARVPREHRA